MQKLCIVCIWAYNQNIVTYIYHCIFQVIESAKDCVSLKRVMIRLQHLMCYNYSCVTQGLVESSTRIDCFCWLITDNFTICTQCSAKYNQASEASPLPNHVFGSSRYIYMYINIRTSVSHTHAHVCVSRYKFKC